MKITNLTKASTPSLTQYWLMIALALKTSKPIELIDG